jgi:hypothetical protein
MITRRVVAAVLWRSEMLAAVGSLRVVVAGVFAEQLS